MLKPRTLFLLSLIALMAYFVSSAFNYEKCRKGWSEPKGCKIGYHENMTILLDDRQPNSGVNIDWDNVEGYEHDLKCRCRKKAKAANYEFFAIYKAGICLGAPGTLADYLKLNGLSKEPFCQMDKRVSVSGFVDGSSCRFGQFRAFFYQIEEPKQSTEEKQEGEEEISAGPPAEEQEKPACKEVSDVFLLLDSSGSMYEEGFQIEKDFTLAFIKRFDLTKSRIAIIQYDDQIQKKLTWSQSSNMTLQQHLNWVENMTYSGGSTRIGLALETAKDLIVIPEQREGVHMTGIVMTDGESHDQVHGTAQILRDQYKCKMIAIGVGEYNFQQLVGIVGENHKNDHIILKDTIEALGKNMTTEINKLIKKTCS